jgi:hypothetical protein
MAETLDNKLHIDNKCIAASLSQCSYNGFSPGMSAASMSAKE